ncbi:methylated-DNA--[protein]-cysteine S-methyltransferase [Algihabitans albus]|uniref:methylated-DNA--[protein]-cysteine S-methyltransferase n=1 Tax=Algihabitans albus TaxID=2164067 RepID=UPI000E5D9A0B|nr:methylated-DNA--[protein]-cysteine S-methyltransferase [Algihabitans albus]
MPSKRTHRSPELPAATQRAADARARRPAGRRESLYAFTYVDSPLGQLLIAGDERSLRLIGFPSGSRATTPGPGWRRDDGRFASVAEQLRSYFAGELKQFDLTLRTSGTAFQTSVWSALRRIPHGQTVTYAELALSIGRPSAVRAVGAANGANPLPIVVPCHRVIGTNGSLTGFGGGLDAKRFLLDHEKQVAGR